MPVHNSSKFIEESVSSVLNQTYSNFELLIVDDCSSDNSYELMRNLEKKDFRIHIFKNETKSGAAATRNLALKNAKGDFIAFLDSDDLWKPNKLEVQMNFMLTNAIAFSFTSYELVDEDGKEMGKQINVPSFLTYHQYLKNTIIGCLTVVIDKRTTGYFEMPIIKTSQDMALWLLILKKGLKAYGISQSLAYYRVRKNSNSSKKLKTAIDVWRVYREIEKLSLFYSMICFISYAFHAVWKRL